MADTGATIQERQPAATRPKSVLFLCTGNSARSILAEAILNHEAGGAVRAYSAGSQPAGLVREGALRQLQAAGIATDGLRSKSWSEFEAEGAPAIDFVITVCDNAANEVCPLWPGHPMKAHWGIPDPAAVTGSDAEVERAYREAFTALQTRIRLFLALPLEQTFATPELQHALDGIGGR